MPPTRTALQERLFSEARRYHEKANVVDHVADRMSFIATGIVEFYPVGFVVKDDGGAVVGGLLKF